MTKEKKYTPDEVHAIATAFVQAVQDPIHRAAQFLDAFMQHLHGFFEVPCPVKCSGWNISHALHSLFDQQLQEIKVEVQKFNTTLHLVHLSQLSGVSNEQKTNIAIAIHLGATCCPNYSKKYYDATQ